MASLETTAGTPASLRLLANLRRFIRWVTTPHVIFSLIMLVLLYYMVVIPLYPMLETTLTWQPRDLINTPVAVVGEFTLFHYIRMLTGDLGEIYLQIPLGHSFTVSTGATLLSLLIGTSLAWLVVRTDMPGRKLVLI